jgi:hypothetical protein
MKAELFALLERTSDLRYAQAGPTGHGLKR